MKPGSPEKSRHRFASRRARLLLVLAAAMFHVSVTATVLMIGKSPLGSSEFNQTGLGTFASDGFMYQDEVVELCARATRLVCQNRFPPRRQLILGFRTPGRSAVRGFPLCLSSPRLLFPLFSAQNKSNGHEDEVKDE
jgi:hypothetical protein